MSEEILLVPAEGTRALEAEETTTLVPISVAELATKMVTVMDLITALIPDLRKPHPATKKKVRGARTIPRDAIVAILAMVESCEVFSSRNSSTRRALTRFSNSTTATASSTIASKCFGPRSRTVEARWAEVTEQALTAYHMAKRYAKDPRYPELAHDVAIIGGLLDRTKGTTSRTKREPKPE